MPRPRFDLLAPAYVWLERASYRGLLQWCRTALLAELTTATRVLVLGDGDGRFLEAFAAANPHAEIDALDVSPAMTELARRRVANVPEAAARVRFEVADALSRSFPSEQYDLIVTNFFLDCFTRPQLEELIPRLAASLRPGGRWLVGDFRLPPRTLPRLAARVALAGMYLFFRVVTRIPAGELVDPDPLLARHGLTRGPSRERLGGFLTATLWVK